MFEIGLTLIDRERKDFRCPAFFVMIDKAQDLECPWIVQRMGGISFCRTGTMEVIDVSSTGHRAFNIRA